MSIDVRSLSGISAIQFKGPGLLNIHQGSSERLTIDAPEYLFDQITSAVEDGRLNLAYRDAAVASLSARRETIRYHLEIKDLRSLAVFGSGHVNIPDLDCDSLDIQLMGSGSVNFRRLTADHLTSHLAGSGSLTLSGDVECQHLKLTGSGQYLADGLVSDFASLMVRGPGNSYVMALNELNAEITGSGNISYKGYPEIHKQILGSGKVLRQRKIGRQNTRGAGHVK